VAVERKILVEYRSPEGPVATQVRSTLLMSGIQALRTFGYYERYLERLPREYHDRILFAVGPEWLPIELGVVHYRACDALDLTDSELDEIGQHVSQKIMGTFLGTLTRSTRDIGGSPWLPLSQYARLWQRILVGGSCRVEQIGPKDAIVTSRGIPMLETRYFRTAYRGVQRGAGLLFAKIVTARESKLADKDPHSTATLLSWV
jgi:hypothetical protein